MTPRVAMIPVTDESLARSWGDRIYRVAFQLTLEESAGSYSLTLSAEDRETGR